MGTILEFGNGRIHVEMIKDGERYGVMFRPTEKTHLVGEWASKSLSPYTAQPNDVVLWFDNIESLRVVQDELSRAALNMQGVLNEFAALVA